MHICTHIHMHTSLCIIIIIQIGNLENFYHFKLVLESDIADSNNLTKGDDHQVTTRSIGALKIVSEQPHLTYQLQQRIEVRL